MSALGGKAALILDGAGGQVVTRNGHDRACSQAMKPKLDRGFYNFRLSGFRSGSGDPPSAAVIWQLRANRSKRGTLAG